MPRILIWVIAVPLVLIIAAAILVPLLLDEDKLVAMAAEALEKETGAILTVEGGASIAIFPTIALSLGDTALTMPGDAASSLSVSSLKLGVQLRPLLTREVKVDELAVDGLVLVTTSTTEEQPQADTASMTDAELDAFYTERRKQMQEAGASVGAEAALVVPLALEVATLSVTDSRIEQLDPETGERSVIQLRELAASDLNLDGRPIPLELSLSLAGAGDDPDTEVELSGEVRVDQASQRLEIDRLEITVTGATPEPVRLAATGGMALGQPGGRPQIADRSGGNPG